MVKVIYKTTRLSTKTLFFPKPQGMDKLAIVAREAGHLLEESTTFSNDKLVRTHTAVWASKEVLDSYNEIELVKDFIKRRRWYDQQTDQTQLVTIIEN